MALSWGIARSPRDRTTGIVSSIRETELGIRETEPGNLSGFAFLSTIVVR
jgi:hypothetical protein